MKKIFKTTVSAVMAVTMIAGSAMPVSAEYDDSEYLGHYEEIRPSGCIVKMKDINNEPDYPNYNCYPVSLTEEKVIGFDGTHRAYFDDDTYDGYEESDNITGFYYIGIEPENLLKDNEIEEVYATYEVIRNGFYMYYGEYVANSLGGGHNKLFKYNDLLKNDANNDGKIDSYDALNVLNSLVGNDTFTIEEKIQLDIMNCCVYPTGTEYHTANFEPVYTLTSEKALEILYQIVDNN